MTQRARTEAGAMAVAGRGSSTSAQTAGRLLPGGAPAARPYVLARLLADLGETRTALTERTVRRIHASLPVPVEQEVLWADVSLGVRSHGVVLTDAGIFLKDGPAEDVDEDEDDEDGGILAAMTLPGLDDDDERDDDRVVDEGIGYHYVRWESFDPARVSHRDGAPTLDGETFCDGPRFRAIANACVRYNNRRVRARRAGRAAVRGTGLFGTGTPVRSVCRSTPAATVSFCFGEDGTYKFYTDDGLPKFLEVPLDQYDAVLRRMRAHVQAGDVPGLDDPAMAAVLVRAGTYTYGQAVNVARTGRAPNVAYRERTGSVLCRDPRGLGFWLTVWLRARMVVTRGKADESGAVAGQVSDAVSEVLADGARAQADAGKDTRLAAGEGVAKVIASNAVSTAGYALGSTGARVLLSAVGVASGPLGMIAGMALGDVIGRRGTEAVGMARDLFFEPKARIMERLLNGVIANVVFEHALTPAEQGALAELMARVDPRAYQRLGADLAQSDRQEDLIRAFVTPLVQTIRCA